MSCFSFLRGKKQNFVSDEKVHTAVDSASTLVDDDASWAAATSKAPTVKSTPTSKQLNALRDEMRKEGLDWYIVFSDDEHASEYTAPPEQRRAFLTGFTGSAGTAIVKAGDASEAHCFADGRYWVQAGEQLDENWTLHKVGLGGEDNWDGFIAKAVRKGLTQRPLATVRGGCHMPLNHTQNILKLAAFAMPSQTQPSHSSPHSKAQAQN